MICRHPAVVVLLIFAGVRSAGLAGSNTQDSPIVESTEERTRRFTVVPSYSYSFFNNGRDAWQEENVQIYYQVNSWFVAGAEIDIMQRPPSGTDISYAAFASFYPTRWLEIRGKMSFTPNPNFAAKQMYLGGFQYQLMPRLAVSLDYQRLNFTQGSIDQLKPGVVFSLTDNTFLTVRYVRGWAYGSLGYDYYSAALDIGLPGGRRLNLGFAYGTDPDSEVGGDGTSITSLSPAYTYSVFFTQPVSRDLKIFAGVQYVYRLNRDGGELYQQLTPTVGLSWKF